jgi:hypothetical protein
VLLEVEVLISIERASRTPPRKAAIRERMKAALRQASVSEIVVGRRDEAGKVSLVGRILEGRGSYPPILNPQHS